MDISVRQEPAVNLRDLLAQERTFLAWIRTGIALMGFGFVVAHFGLFADEPYTTQSASGARPHELSLWFGTALVVVGVIVNLYSAQHYVRLAGELRHGQWAHRFLTKQGVLVASCLALFGIAMALYMFFVLAHPPSVHA
jgi:putative membrane protein